MVKFGNEGSLLRPGNVDGTAPPSGLPAISPTWGRSDVTPAFANYQRG
ncbi:hypothetical protein ABID25_004452 [Mesorhizobium abyssinicae]